MLDLLIRNGLVIDGSGNPGYYAGVGVEGDTLRILRGDTSALPAARTIDASGHVVAPGFIDMHSHAGLTILKEPRHEPKVRQGVTTELIGIDGNSHAPFKTQEDLHRYIELDSGLNGEPPMPADWLTVAGQLSTFDNKVAVNICFILGNSPVRIWAVGWDDRPATRAELDDMKSVVREVCEEGSFGISTGLDYPPGSYADTNELIEISKVVARAGGFYHTHTRALLKQKGLLAPWLEAIPLVAGETASQRLCDAEAASAQPAPDVATLARVTRPSVTGDGQHAPALRFGDARVMALMAAIAGFCHLIAGFDNRALVQRMRALLDPGYSARQATYDLRRLRRKHIIQRVDGTNRYQLTPTGRAVAVLYGTELTNKGLSLVPDSL